MSCLQRGLTDNRLSLQQCLQLSSDALFCCSTTLAIHSCAVTDSPSELLVLFIYFQLQLKFLHQ